MLVLVIVWAIWMLLATPTMAAWVDGESHTITGSGFGTKSPAKPLIWAPLSASLNPTSDGTVTSWFSAPNADLGTAPGGYAGASWNLALDHLSGGGEDSNTFFVDLVTPPSYVYFRVKRYLTVNLAPENDLNNHKMDRWWDDTFASAPAQVNLYVSTDWSGWYKAAVEGMGHNETIPGEYPHGQWNNTERLYRASSSPGTGDGLIVDRINNVTKANYVNALTHDSDSTAISMIGVSDDASNLVHSGYPTIPSWFIWYRDIYMDTTWSRVEIGDNAVYASCSSTEIQLPTSWSDTSITITVRKGDFAALQGKYYFVFDASNNVVASGEITVNQTGSGASGGIRLQGGAKVL